MNRFDCQFDGSTDEEIWDRAIGRSDVASVAFKVLSRVLSEEERREVHMTRLGRDGMASHRGSSDA